MIFTVDELFKTDCVPTKREKWFKATVGIKFILNIIRMNQKFCNICIAVSLQCIYHMTEGTSGGVMVSKVD